MWKTAERIEAAGLVVLGDKGYVRLSDVMFCPSKDRGKPQWKKDAGSAHAKLRSPGERAIVQYKQRGVLRRIRCRPNRVSQITRAVLALQLRETE